MRAYSTIFRPLTIIRVVLHNNLRCPLTCTGVETGVGVVAWYFTEWDKRLVVSYRPLNADLYWLRIYTDISIVSERKEWSADWRTRFSAASLGDNGPTTVA